MEREDQVGGAQVGSEVAAGLGEVVNDRLAQFVGNLFQLLARKRFQIGGAMHTRQQIVHASSTPFVIFDFRFSIFD